jgi:anti-sigma factor RsiW
MDDDELSVLIRKNAARYKASEPLRASVRTQIALQLAARSDKKVRSTRSWFNFDAGWGMGLAGFASGVLLTVALGLLVPRLMLQDALPAELVADHVRALKTGPLFEVASSDRHTVKPWFQGKLDYAPPVVDLQADGFPLLGGRVDHVSGAAVAALAYASNKHIVSVLVWPVAGKTQPQSMQRNGFNLLNWNEGGMQIWVISDLEASEIERFAQAWRARATAH